jgi:hypothetical protein
MAITQDSTTQEIYAAFEAADDAEKIDLWVRLAELAPIIRDPKNPSPSSKNFMNLLNAYPEDFRKLSIPSAATVISLLPKGHEKAVVGIYMNEIFGPKLSDLPQEEQVQKTKKKKDLQVMVAELRVDVVEAAPAAAAAAAAGKRQTTFARITGALLPKKTVVVIPSNPEKEKEKEEEEEEVLPPIVSVDEHATGLTTSSQAAGAGAGGGAVAEERAASPPPTEAAAAPEKKQISETERFFISLIEGNSENLFFSGSLSFLESKERTELSAEISKLSDKVSYGGLLQKLNCVDELLKRQGMEGAAIEMLGVIKESIHNVAKTKVAFVSAQEILSPASLSILSEKTPRQIQKMFRESIPKGTETSPELYFSILETVGEVASTDKRNLFDNGTVQKVMSALIINAGDGYSKKTHPDFHKRVRRAVLPGKKLERAANLAFKKSDKTWYDIAVDEVKGKTPKVAVDAASPRSPKGAGGG